MRVTFWGVRGSIATPGEQYQRYGGNTPCVLVTVEGAPIIVLDGGMGVRWLGAELVANGQPVELTMFLSHTHWDHIQGIPFAPFMYIPGNRVDIYGFGGPSESLHQNLLRQMQTDYCPVPNFFLRDDVGATVTMFECDDESLPLGPASVSSHQAPCGEKRSVGIYRIEAEGRSLAYLTDVEYPGGPSAWPQVIDVIKGVDLLIHDGQYRPQEREKRRNWGHSTYTEALEMATLAQVGKLVLFHHSPSRTDQQLDQIATELADSEIPVELAREGLEFVV